MNINKLWKKIINNPYIHPVIWGLFPVVSLYTHNLDEAWPQLLFTPILYVLIFVAISWIFFFLIFRNIYKTGVILSIWLILFFSYGHINLYLGAREIQKILPVSLNILSLAVTFFILIAAVILLFKYKGKPIVMNQLLNFVAIVLFTMSLYRMIPYSIKASKAFESVRKYEIQHKENVTVKNNDESTYPDIYYFIFDRYGRQDVLKSYFDYDNSKFLTHLEDNGFIVDKKSNANYPATFLSLASSLNMEHLTFLPEVLGENYSDRTVVYRTLLDENEVVSFLKDRGYKYLHVGSIWKGFMQSSVANKNYNLFINFDEFLYYIYENTLLNAVWGKVSGQQLYIGELRLKKSIENQNYQLSKIKEIIPTDSPQFVFAHFLLPHPPYLFNDDCTALDFEVVRQRLQEVGYRSQTNCANKIMKIIAEDIMKKSKRPAIIIFQSDEGPYLPIKYFPSEQYPEKSPERSFKIHSGILNSIYLPEIKNDKNLDALKEKFSKGWTPVNTFRLIFNHYFGTEYKILEDRTYIYRNSKTPYKFQEITDVVKVK